MKKYLLAMFMTFMAAMGFSNTASATDVAAVSTAAQGVLNSISPEVVTIGTIVIGIVALMVGILIILKMLGLLR